MQVNYSIDIGTVIQTLIFFFGFLSVIIRTETNVKDLKTEVTEIQREIRVVADVVTKLAVQNERLDNFGHRLNVVEDNVESIYHRNNHRIEK